MQKIIVVSASYAQLQMVESWLKPNYSVACLATARQLEAEMAAGKPDLVLMDVSLPGKDGFQTCYETKKNDRFRQTPIILCLENGSDTEIHTNKFWAKQRNASDTLVKPLKETDLLAAVKHSLPP